MSWVYRCFDVDGHLLYIGRTGSPRRRVTNHRSTTSWWPEVARMSWERHKDAELAELLAIVNEHPRYNVAGNPGGPPRRRRNPRVMVK